VSPTLSGATWFWLIAPPIVFVIITLAYYFGYGKERGE